MATGQRRTNWSPPGQAQSRFGTASSSRPFLVTLTDLSLWTTLVCVTIGFGGRMAYGQLALVIGASVTALFWLLHQLTDAKPRYRWTGSEWLWLAGIGVGVAQIIPLPEPVLLQISPAIKSILPLWFNSEFLQLVSARWNQVSLAPWETASALATFVSYAMLFLVAAQRIQTVRDVERFLCGVALMSVAMLLFAQVQFLTANGKFFWVFEHPHMTTDSYPLGCFTNRNHLAQFLALGIAPLIWWLLRRFHQQTIDQSERRNLPGPVHLLSITLLLLCLGGIGLTVLMTLSRGGLLAVAVTSIVAITLMMRIGLSSMKFGSALMAVGIIVGGLLSYSKYESVLTDRLDQKSGRQEIWQANFEVAKDFPILGTGIGTHADAYHLRIKSRQDDGLEYSHAECGYLQVASESGFVGLAVAVLFILTSYWWCIVSLTNPDVKISSAAAAILASLSANVVHALVDFFWYTPACMLLLGIQLACAMRLYQLTLQSRQARLFSFQIPRIITLAAMAGVVGLMAWMGEMKLPAVAAEAHRIQSILLGRIDEKELTEEEKVITNQQRLAESILAARRDPHDSRLQEAAASAYLQVFEIKQEHSENTMSASMLRDAIRSSQFESVTASNEWLQRAVGANLKQLKLAVKSLKRSLAASPLRARSYVLLVDTLFLEKGNDPELQAACLKQALKVRPRDPEMLYLVGRSELQNGDLDKAIHYWRPAFERSRAIQERIAEVTANEMDLDFFESRFKPDWKAMEIIARAFAKAGRETESQQARDSILQKGMIRAKETTSDKELEEIATSLESACRDLGDITAATDILTYAAERLPHNYSIRYRLGLDLLESDRASEAAEHLQWCARREPENELLQQMATRAISERKKKSSSTGRSKREIDQTGWRQ